MKPDNKTFKSGKNTEPAPENIFANEKSKMKKRLIALSVILAATLTVIWGHSFMPPEESAKESGYIFELLRPFVEFFIGEGNFTELFVRKAAHFTEFFILGCELILLMRYVLCDMRAAELPDKEGKKEEGAFIRVKKRVLLANAWILGTFCALVDETIQIFSGRGSVIPDVWLDSAGCLCGVLLFGLLFVLRRLKASVVDIHSLSQTHS